MYICYIILNPKGDHYEDMHKACLKFVGCTKAFSYAIFTRSFSLFSRCTSKDINLVNCFLERCLRYSFKALSGSNVHS